MKIITKEVFEKENEVITEDNTKLFDDEKSRMIIKIVTSMSNFLYVKLSQHYEFIVNCSCEKAAL